MKFLIHHSFINFSNIVTLIILCGNGVFSLKLGPPPNPSNVISLKIPGFHHPNFNFTFKKQTSPSLPPASILKFSPGRPPKPGAGMPTPNALIPWSNRMKVIASNGYVYQVDKAIYNSPGSFCQNALATFNRPFNSSSKSIVLCYDSSPFNNSFTHDSNLFKSLDDSNKIKALLHYLSASKSSHIDEWYLEKDEATFRNRIASIKSEDLKQVSDALIREFESILRYLEPEKLKELNPQQLSALLDTLTVTPTPNREIISNFFSKNISKLVENSQLSKAILEYLSQLETSTGFYNASFISDEAWKNLFSNPENCAYISPTLFKETLKNTGKASVYTAECAKHLPQTIFADSDAGTNIKNAPNEFFEKIIHSKIEDSFMKNAKKEQIQNWGTGHEDPANKCLNLDATKLTISNIEGLQAECLYNLFKNGGGASKIAIGQLWKKAQDGIFSLFTDPEDLKSLLESNNMQDVDYQSFKPSHRQVFIANEDACGKLKESFIVNKLKVSAKCFAAMPSATQSAFIAKGECVPDQFSELNGNVDVGSWISKKTGGKFGSKTGLAVLLDISGIDSCIRSLGATITEVDDSPCKHFNNKNQVMKHLDKYFEMLPDNCLNAIGYKPTESDIKEIMTKDKKFIPLISYDDMEKKLNLTEDTDKDGKPIKLDNALINTFLQVPRFCRNVPSDKIDRLAAAGALATIPPSCVAQFSNKETIVDAAWKQMPVGAGRLLSSTDYQSLNNKFGAFSDEQFVEFGLDVPKKENAITASMASKDITSSRMSKAQSKFISRLAPAAFQGFNKEIMQAIQPAALTDVDASQAASIPENERKNLSVDQIKQIGINCKGDQNPLNALFTEAAMKTMSPEQTSAIEQRKKAIAVSGSGASETLMNTVSITLLMLFFGVVLF